MNKVEMISTFYKAILNDPRISFLHIAIYLSVVQQAKGEDFSGKVQISRKKIMQLSKIKSLSTYHRCMEELQEFGYIAYVPSFHPSLGSLVILHDLS